METQTGVAETKITESEFVSQRSASAPVNADDLESADAVSAGLTVERCVIAVTDAIPAIGRGRANGGESQAAVQVRALEGANGRNHDSVQNHVPGATVQENGAAHKTALEIREILDQEARAFCDTMEKRIEYFCNQSSLRLEAVSEQMIRNFSDALNRETSAVLNSFIADLERHRSSQKTDFREQLSRFSMELEDLSNSRLEAHRQEMLSLSSTLKMRLKRVAHALEAVHQAPDDDPQEESESFPI